MAVIGLLAGTLLVAFGGVRSVSASCANTSPLEVVPTAVRPGEPITITGGGFAATCHDQGQGGGCFGTGKPTREKPAEGIDVRILQEGRSVLLATVDADDTYRIRITTTVPAALSPGPAIVYAGKEVPVEILPAGG